MNKAEEKMIQAANELTVELIRLQKEVIDAQHENIQLRKKIAELERNINKAIADAVRDAMNSISKSFDWDWSHVSSYEYFELLAEYAEKIEKGEL